MLKIFQKENLNYHGSNLLHYSIQVSKPIFYPLINILEGYSYTIYLEELPVENAKYCHSLSEKVSPSIPLCLTPCKGSNSFSL